MKVYTIDKMVGPTKGVLTVNKDGFTYDLIESKPVQDKDDPEKMTRQEIITSSETNKFADIMSQGDFGDYALYVRCFDKSTDEIRTLAAGSNRLINLLASTYYRPRNLGDGVPANKHYIDDFLWSLYNSVTTYPDGFQAPHTQGGAGYIPKPKGTTLQNEVRILMALIVPFADSPPDDWVMVVPVGHSDTTIKGVKPITGKSWLREVRQEVSPSMAFGAGPTKDGDIWTFTVTVLNPDGKPAKGHAPDIYFENTAGILLTQRVKTDPKTAQAKCLLSVAGLPKDYPLRLKAGFKYFSGMADFETTT